MVEKLTFMSMVILYLVDSDKMRDHGSYKCQLCLLEAKLAITWARTTSEHKRLKQRLGDKIPPAKYIKENVHLCGSCYQFSNPKFCLKIKTNQLKARNAQNRT